MNSANGKISFLQTCMVLMLTIGLTSHVIVNPMVLDASGRDAWISVLMTAVLFFPWCGILVLIMKKSGQQKLQPWLAKQTTPWISWLLIAPLCLLLYLMGGMTVVHTTIWTITNYLPATPKFVLIISLTYVCQYSAKIGIRTIAICSGILLPTVVILGFFVAISNTSEKDYNLLKPFLEHGLQPAMNGMIYVGSGFAELVLIILMQHHLKSQLKWWKLVILAFIFVSITMGPIIGAISEFGPSEAAKQMISPYEQWRLVKLGDYIEHVDFLSVYQWLAGASVKISLAMFLMADILPLSNPKTRSRFITIIWISYILLPMLPINQNDFYLWMYQIFFPASLVATLIITALLAGISLFTKVKKEKTL